MAQAEQITPSEPRPAEGEIAPEEQPADQASAPAVALPDTAPDADRLVGLAEPVAASPNSDNLQRILHMRVPVIVKVAEKHMAAGDILKFSLGSVIQFDKDAYQLIDLMVNNSTIGLGQPIKVGENFGLKITQIGPVADTIRSLGGLAPPQT
jgi:flagellar motor switch protein FliN